MCYQKNLREAFGRDEEGENSQSSKATWWKRRELSAEREVSSGARGGFHECWSHHVLGTTGCGIFLVVGEPAGKSMTV